jgi:hypothetical protein
MAQAPARSTRPQEVFIKTEAIDGTYSKKFPNKWWCRVGEANNPKSLTIQFDEDQSEFINTSFQNNMPLVQGVHYAWNPAQGGTFLLPHIGRDQPREVPVIPITTGRQIRKAPARQPAPQNYIPDDMPTETDWPMTWQEGVDPSFSQAGKLIYQDADELCTIIACLADKHPSLSPEDVRPVVISMAIRHEPKKSYNR